MRIPVRKLALTIVLAGVSVNPCGIVQADDDEIVADFSAASGFAGPGGDQVYPFDAPMPWVHGHYQEIPAYGGYGAFAPYNYKHVLSQSQAAGGWGMSPTMPYSQQYWHPYQPQAAMTAEQAAAVEYAAEMARLQAREDYRMHGYRPAPPQPHHAAGFVTPTSGTMPHAGHDSQWSHDVQRMQDLRRQHEARQAQSMPTERRARRPNLLDSLREAMERR